MEMKTIPEAGYQIIGLPIAGFHRKKIWKNFRVLAKLLVSQWKAKSIIKNFQPHAVVGVGGYASGPTLKVASGMNIPTLIQEQNSYAGVTNKLLAKKAHKICVAYEGMEKFFPADKIMITGNPVTQSLQPHSRSREQALKKFWLVPAKKTVGIVVCRWVSGSINNALIVHIRISSENSDTKVICQTG